MISPTAGRLHEPVPGEPGRVEEALQLRRLPDERVVVGRDLVVALPSVRQAHVEK